jgi:hypothetical protein
MQGIHVDMIYPPDMYFCFLSDMNPLSGVGGGGASGCSCMVLFEVSEPYAGGVLKIVTVRSFVAAWLGARCYVTSDPRPYQAK